MKMPEGIGVAFPGSLRELELFFPGSLRELELLFPGSLQVSVAQGLCYQVFLLICFLSEVAVTTSVVVFVFNTLVNFFPTKFGFPAV